MTTTLQVKGMTCGHCEKAVKSALSDIDGVTDVKVNLESGAVDVEHEESVTPAQMKDAVEEQGYDVA